MALHEKMKIVQDKSILYKKAPSEFDFEECLDSSFRDI